jgi:type I restriction-modification system DNA methylase subunit
MFQVNKLQKMKHHTPLGSRIALVHNGSALFTGDAGQGESNIRRWVLENDWLEAIIALPLNIFYNTGIATYIWVLANKKAEARRDKVQLIDASGWFQPLRRNLGKKNCELSDGDIQRIIDLYLGEAQETAESKWFDTQDFGYWKITVERPLRLKSQLSDERIEPLRFATGDEAIRTEIYATHGEALYTDFAKLKPTIEAWLKGEDENEEDENEDSGDDSETPAARKAVPAKRRKKLLDASTWLRDKALMVVAQRVQKALGSTVFDDHNEFRTRFDTALKAQGDKLGAPEKKAIYKAVSWRDETAPPVIAKRSKLKTSDFFEPGFDGAYLETVGKDRFMVEYEPDSELRDTEQVPLKELGGIDAFFEREVLPHAPDAWIATDKTQIGYEISFARYFYKPAPLRTLEDIRADILALEQQSEGLLHKIVGVNDSGGVYPNYRRPKMRWLPAVPEHWNEQRAKTFFREVDERSKTGQEELLSVSHLTGVTPRSQKKVTMFKAASYVGSKLCRPGDIVINTLWAWMAALGASKHEGIVSPAYGVYRPHHADSFNPAYLDYLLRTRAYVAEYIGRSTGIRSSRLRLYPNQFRHCADSCPRALSRTKSSLTCALRMRTWPASSRPSAI